MQQTRRQFLRSAGITTVAPVLSRTARAQTYPSRPVRLIVGLPPGSGADIQARLMGQWLSERLGQPFIIENRTGAGTNLATEAVVRAPPDGYTLLWVLVVRFSKIEGIGTTRNERAPVNRHRGVSIHFG